MATEDTKEDAPADETSKQSLESKISLEDQILIYNPMGNQKEEFILHYSSGTTICAPRCIKSFQKQPGIC